MEQSPALSDLIRSLAEEPLTELPKILNSVSTRWPYPRGDLYNWIQPLNRFDDILEDFNNRYGLVSGPQSIPFGFSLLLEGSKDMDAQKLRQLGFGPEGDRELVESILRFTKLLFEKCGNRNLYNSGDRLNALVNTTSLSLLHCTLRVSLCVAQRNRDRSRGSSQLPAPSVHFGLDLEKLQQMIAPIPPPPMSSKRNPSSPVKTSKGKEKAMLSTRSRRSSSAVNPNDFRSLCQEQPQLNGSQKTSHAIMSDWREWTAVKLTFSPSKNKEPDETNLEMSTVGEQSSPISARRVPSNGTSRLRSTSAPEDQDGEAVTHHEPKPKTPDLERLELTSKELMDSSIDQILEQSLKKVPESSQYELLHKLRTAYGLVESNSSRQLILSIRLLSMAILACVSPEDSFVKKFFGQDPDIQHRRQLIQQLISLLQDSDKAKPHIPLSIQTMSLEVLAAMVRQKSITGEICNALQVSSTHGVLLLLSQRGLKDLQEDGDQTDNQEGDEWRETVFSMLRTVMEAASINNRLHESFVPSSLISCYVATLGYQSNKALRIHLRVLETFKLFFDFVKDGLVFLSTHNAFDKLADLLNFLTRDAVNIHAAGNGFPDNFKTPNTDYEIPYVHQQVIRQCIVLVNKVGSHQGPQADRILRAMIDSPKLLSAFRVVVENCKLFGPHTWSEVVKCICGFLHNEPTSYTVLAEAGLPGCILETVTMEKVPSITQAAQSSTDEDLERGSDEERSQVPQVIPATQNGPDSEPKEISPVPQNLPQGIHPSASVMEVLGQAFGAICLTNAGLEAFKASNALAKFFEIFESPQHVKALKNSNELNGLGSTFDEIVRHHPQLRESVMSILMVTVARVRWKCRTRSWIGGAGPKLWVDKDGQLAVSGADDALLLEITPEFDLAGSRSKGTSPLHLPDGNLLLPDPSPPSVVGLNQSSERDNDGLEAADYMSCIMGFLGTFFENQSHCSYFMEVGGTDLILDCMTLPSLPIADLLVNSQGASLNLGVVVHDMAETKPHLILPILVQRALHASDQLEHLVHNQPSGVATYFAPLVEQSQTVQQEPRSQDIMKNGTKIVKSLTVLHSHVQALTEIFGVSAYGSRSTQAALFGQVYLSDLYSQLCIKLGPISAACLRESLTLQRLIPKKWLTETQPETDHHLNDDIKKILGFRTSQTDETPPHVDHESNEETAPGRPRQTSDNMSIDEQPSSDLKAINSTQDSAAFRNVKTLRRLMIEVPTAITSFLGTLGRGLVGKRRIDPLQKQNVHRVAGAISVALKALLDPHPLAVAADQHHNTQHMEVRFAYLVVVLDMINDILLDFQGHLSDQMGSCVTSVLLAFKNSGGLRLLRRIGTEFFEQLKRCEVARDTIHVMTTANSGLKICLEILDGITSSQCIIDSPQSNFLKNNETSRPFYFVPAQLLLELRLEALPLTRLIWDSDYADQASEAVIERLILILKHILNGDGELEAYKHADSRPKIPIHPPRKVNLEAHKLAEVMAAGIDDALAKEALFRCAGNISAAKEYAKAFERNPNRQRCPVPADEINSDVQTTSSSSSASQGLASTLLSSGIDIPLAEGLNSITDDATEANVDTDPRDENASSAMSINNILNADRNAVQEESAFQSSSNQRIMNLSVQDRDDQAEQEYTLDNMNRQRDSIRDDLAERCNNILNNHQFLTFELSELIMSATKKLSDEAAKTFRENSSSLLINALLSLQPDETIDELKGKRIAASAHLNALLLQDKAIYESAEALLRDAFDQLIQFIHLHPVEGKLSGDLAFPWIGPVLLIFEKILSRDAEPPRVEWRMPTDLETVDQPRFTHNAVLEPAQTEKLFQAILEMLPRIGKDQSFALSVSRVLVILTRSRELATQLAQKRNIQRLFLMVKQLAVWTDERLQSSLMITLRHIVEDEETLRRIMKSEITSYFRQRSSPRSIEATAFIRDVHHLVLRSPALFVEVANEVVKIQRFEGRDRQNLVLRKLDGEDGPSNTTNDLEGPSGLHSAIHGGIDSDSKPLIDATESKEKQKHVEYRPPTIEHPDGVIHFLLSELLAYKDVEDKDTGSASVPNGETSVDSAFADDSREPSLAPHSDESTPAPPPQPKPKSAMKAEDHPVYVYRCFLLQCLTELLLSYNRTKIEFIGYSRKADPMASTPSKPRSGILNYLLNALVPTPVEPEDSMTYRKKNSTSILAMKLIVALYSRTGEVAPPDNSDRYGLANDGESDDEPELMFVRRFVLEHAIKAFKDATASTEPIQGRFARLLGLADLFHRLLTSPLRDSSPHGSSQTSPKGLGRMMFEKNMISILTASLADIDLALPGANRVIKHILKPLRALTVIAENLSLTSPTPLSSALGTSEDDTLSSATSVSDMGDPRENTPDLFQNSALGILEPNQREHSGSESEIDGDEDMFEFDEGYGNEMEYDDEVPPEPANDGEVVSDDEEGTMPGETSIEGVPGDVPMGFEFVVDEQDDDMEAGSDSEDDDEEDDEEDEDEDDETDPDEEEDFEIEEDEQDMGGEINVDDENDSLAEHEHGDWQDDDEDEADYGEDPEDVALEVPSPGRADLDDGGPAAELNNLLQVLNGGGTGPGAGTPGVVPFLGEGRVNDPHDDEEDDEGDDDDDADDDDGDMGENEDVAFETFDEMIDGEDDIMDTPHHHALGLDHLQFELPFLRRNRQLRGPGPFPSFFSRNPRPGVEMHHILSHPQRRPAVHGRSGIDDGTNPLLQRSSESETPVPHAYPPPVLLPSGLDFAGFPPLPSGATAVINAPAGHRSHGRMLDAIMSVLSRPGTDLEFLRTGRIEININAQGPDIQTMLRGAIPVPTTRPARSDHPGSLSADPRPTMVRWQEETRLLFGSAYIEFVPRVQKSLLSKLVPPAQEEERVRRKKAEEEAAAAREREEEERRKAEAERAKKEEEEREAAAKAEAERQAAAAAAAAAAAEAEAAEAARRTGSASGENYSAEPERATSEPMEDVQSTSQSVATAGGAAAPSGETVTENQPRVFTTIRGRQLDITGMEIDAEYLEALPEDLREEVIMQQYASQRAQAREEGNVTGIDEEFLNALPEEIREEIRQQEAYDRRRRERDEARRRAAEQGGPAQAEDMDSDNFLATLDPALRRAILAEQPPEILQQLDPRHAAEGRAHARTLFRSSIFPVGGRDARDGPMARDDGTKDNKRQVVQMIDRPGVATLLRLMFIPWHGSIKENLKSILRCVCGHRQTRFEVVNLLLAILKEGSTDVNALERSLASLSLRAKTSGVGKAPQLLKRTTSSQPSNAISDEMTPVMVISQCLSALYHLSRHDPHVRSIFLREVDVSMNTKSQVAKKGKAKETKTTKYPLNDLLSLLDRKLLTDSSACLQAFAELLFSVTQPLPLLLRKEESKEKEVGKNTAQAPSPGTSRAADEQQLTSDTAPESSSQDVTMVEAPAPPFQGAGELVQTQSQLTDGQGPSQAQAEKEDDSKEDGLSSKKPFEPPAIPEQNLRLLMGIFTGHDTGRETFNFTSAAMTNLCAIPGTQRVFIAELTSQASSLSQVILKDLDDLLPMIQEAQYGTDLQSVASNRFSPANSDQARLLRVLQALDSILHPKPLGRQDGEVLGVGDPGDIEWTYESLKLGPLWSKLSECLSAMREKENIVSFATILLPLIESLLVVCKNTSLSDAPLPNQIREQSVTSPVAETPSGLEAVFFNFTTEHRKILNEIVRQNPKLMQGNGGFGLLVKNPKVLDFDNKRSYFTKQIHSKRHEHRQVVAPLQLSVRRDHVFNDSYKHLYFKSADEMKYGKLNIRFSGEEGVDAGGVTREWFQVLARGMFDPNYALWEPVAADKTTFHPSRLSGINDQHLSFFKFIGRIIGKALYEGRVLDCHFSRAVYKKMLGKETSLRDMESMDIDYYKSLLWILENDITDVISEDFSVVSEDFGAERVIDLIPNGRNIAVTEENKHEYVQKLVEYRLSGSVAEQLEHFLRGFHDIIPADLISIFNEQELELLISGLPEIDVDDWKANTTYHGYNASSPQIVWFWRMIRGMSNEERAKMLQFITGTSKVPLNGFKELEGLNGATKMSIIVAPGATTQLPTSHTCFNRKSNFHSRNGVQIC